MSFVQAAAKAAAEVEAAMSAARASVTDLTTGNSEMTGSPCAHHFPPSQLGPDPPTTLNMLRGSNTLPGAFQHPSVVQAQQQQALALNRSAATLSLSDFSCACSTPIS